MKLFHRTKDSRVQNLIWQLLDQDITETERTELETILAGSESARRLFAELVDMHQNLCDFFGQDVPVAVAA